MSKHPILHVEFTTRDRESDAKFFQKLFGWEFRQIPEMNYATFMTGQGETGGGLTPVGNGTSPGTITVYSETDDIHATLAKAESLGGKALSSPNEIPGVGWVAYFEDPSGNKLALLQPVSM